jgi:hypothetical protein
MPNNYSSLEPAQPLNRTMIAIIFNSGCPNFSLCKLDLVTSDINSHELKRPCD